MDELKRSRVAARGWLKRATIRLDKAIESADIVELEFIISEFDSRLSNLDSIQAKIELVLPDEDVEDDVGKAAEAREEAIECRIRALRAIRAKAEAAHGETTSIASQNQSVRLPKLELPKFGGDVLEWSTFWEQYEAAVDNSDLPEVSKFVYLRSLLVGEARKCVEGLAVVKENYDIACKALKDRFARPSQIIFAHIDKLLKLGLADGGDLKSVQDTLLLHVRSLERLGIGGDNYGVILTPLILSRLPDKFRLEWARDSAGKESDLNHLLSCLKAEIERQDRSSVLGATQTEQRVLEHRQDERSGAGPGGRRSQLSLESSGPRAPSSPARGRGDQTGRTSARWGPSEGVRSRVPPASGAALQSASPADRCGFCSGPHQAAKCSRFLGLDLSARQQRVRES